MVDFTKEHTLLKEALKFSEEEFITVCKTVNNKNLYNLLETITQARNKILDAMMAHTMERKPNPLQWNAADKAAYVVKTMEDELLSRKENNETPSG